MLDEQVAGGYNGTKNEGGGDDAYHQWRLTYL